jgi:hypothetical protein
MPTGIVTSVQCRIEMPSSAPRFPNGSLHLRQNLHAALVFARVFHIYGTKNHTERWLALECIKQSTRKSEMHCQWETHIGYRNVPDTVEK